MFCNSKDKFIEGRQNCQAEMLFLLYSLNDKVHSPGHPAIASVCQHEATFLTLFSSTLSGNMRAAAPGSVCLFTSIFFLPHPNPSLLCVYHNVSSVSLPFFSLTMKYSDTNLGGPSTPKHSCVDVPLSCHRTPRLPTLPLSSTNSVAFSFPHRCFPSLITSSLSLYSLLFRHSLNRRMAASKIRAKQSQHSCEHLFCIAACLLARSGASFYVWFLCQHQGNATSIY